MKKQTQGYLLYVTKRELLALATIVEERLDITYQPAQEQIQPGMSSGQLWSIQRSKRAFVQRRGIM